MSIMPPEDPMAGLAGAPPPGMAGLAAGPPPGMPDEIDIQEGGGPPGMPPDLAAMLGGGGAAPGPELGGPPPGEAAGEEPRGEVEILDEIRSLILEYMEVASDDIEKSQATQGLKVFQGLLASNQKEQEAAGGITPVHKGMAKALAGP